MTALDTLAAVPRSAAGSGAVSAPDPGNAGSEGAGVRCQRRALARARDPRATFDSPSAGACFELAGPYHGSIVRRRGARDSEPSISHAAAPGSPDGTTVLRAFLVPGGVHPSPSSLFDTVIVRHRYCSTSALFDIGIVRDRLRSTSSGSTGSCAGATGSRSFAGQGPTAVHGVVRLRLSRPPPFDGPVSRVRFGWSRARTSLWFGSGRHPTTTSLRG